jgi:hypothetical protein
LFCLVNAIFKKKGYQLIISIVLLILASLSKESFILFIPAYILLLLWFKTKQEVDKTFIQVIQSNLLLISGLSSILLIELYIVIDVVGTSKIDYAGIDNSFNAFDFLKSTYRFLRHNNYLYIIVFGLFLMSQNVTSWKLNYKNQQAYIINSLILLAIILPQFVLYNKSGIFERYLLPLNLGFSLFIVFLLKKIQEHSSITLFSKRVFFIAIIGVIGVFLKLDTIPNAKSFSNEGLYTTNLLNNIVDNTKENDSILVILNTYENYELGISIKKYLKLHANKKQINFYAINAPTKNGFEKHLASSFSQIFSKNMTDQIDSNNTCIAILQFRNNKDIKTTIDSLGLYNRKDFGYFTAFTKKP